MRLFLKKKRKRKENLCDKTYEMYFIFQVDTSVLKRSIVAVPDRIGTR